MRPGLRHKGTRADGVVRTVTIGLKANAVLERYCPDGSKGHGRFLESLLLLHAERERQMEYAELKRLAASIERQEVERAIG